MSNPTYPIVTCAVWNQEWNQARPFQILQQLLAKAAELQATGKTDNNPAFSQTAEGQHVSRRNWVDTTAANEWISFVEGVCGNHLSITIES